MSREDYALHDELPKRDPKDATIQQLRSQLAQAQKERDVARLASDMQAEANDALVKLVEQSEAALVSLTQERDDALRQVEKWAEAGLCCGDCLKATSKS